MSKSITWITCTVLLALAPQVKAEYRAFELEITDTTNGQVRVLVSNLDPLQYPKYNPTKPTEKIVYKATWMCKGNTSNFRAICPNPKT